MAARCIAAAVAAILALAAPALGQALAQAPANAPRRAVVIGNAAYSAMSPLPGCEPSARLAAAALRRAGFEVTLLTNAGNARIGMALSVLADETQAADSRAVVYACGYVSLLGGRLFLLPVDAMITRESEVLLQGIAARLAYAAVAAPAGAAGLLLIDGAFPPGAEAPPGGVGTPALSSGADSPRAGYALSLSVVDPIAPAPLAAELAAGLDGGGVEVRGFLGSLRRRNSVVLRVVQASEPGRLTGEPPAAVPPAPSPAPPAVAAPPPAAAEPSPPPAAASGPRAAAAPEAQAELSVADRRLVQLELQRLGYYKGRVDGQFRADTTAAVRQFQRELGDAVTGTLTGGQAARLLRRRE